MPAVAGRPLATRVRLEPGRLPVRDDPSGREPAAGGDAAWAALLGAVATAERPVVLALHPGTRVALDDARDRSCRPSVRVVEPQGYRTTLALQLHAAAVLTDSGGVQREAAWLGVPCLVLRGTTEWVEAVAALRRADGGRRARPRPGGPRAGPARPGIRGARARPRPGRRRPRIPPAGAVDAIVAALERCRVESRRDVRVQRRDPRLARPARGGDPERTPGTTSRSWLGRHTPGIRSTMSSTAMASGSCGSWSRRSGTMVALVRLPLRVAYAAQAGCSVGSAARATSDRSDGSSTGGSASSAGGAERRPGAHRGRLPRSRPDRRGRGRPSRRPTRGSSSSTTAMSCSWIRAEPSTGRPGQSHPAPAGGRMVASRRRAGDRQRGDRREISARYRRDRVVVVHNCPPRWEPSTAGVDRLRTASGSRRDAGRPLSRRSACGSGPRGAHRGDGPRRGAAGSPGLPRLRADGRAVRLPGRQAGLGGRFHVLDAVSPEVVLEWVAAPTSTSWSSRRPSQRRPVDAQQAVRESRRGCAGRVSDFPAMRDRHRRSGRSARRGVRPGPIPRDRGAIRHPGARPDGTGGPPRALPSGGPRALELGDRGGQARQLYGDLAAGHPPTSRTTSR